MRILYMGNNWLGWQVFQWLKERNEEIVGLIVHPPEKQRYTKEILELAQLPADRIFDAGTLRREDVIQAVRALAPDVGLSVLLDTILRPPFLGLFPSGVINLHPAYLPFNRGQYPNVWSIIEGTPAGVTIHYLDEGIDTGDIVAQREIPVEPIDTGESLYRKLERAGLELFMEMWPRIRAGDVRRAAQRDQEGTYHKTRDVEAVDRIDLDREYRARELIDLLRARTFPPYRGAYFEAGGRRVYLRLNLEYEKEE